MKALSFTINFIKSFVLVMFLASNLHAMFNLFEGSSSSGTETSPIELIIDGDKRDDDSPTKYYSFYSTVNQNVTSHITDHDETTETCTMMGCYTINKDLTLTLYNLASDGSCDTSTELGNKTKDGEFDWTFSANGGKSYCLKVEGNGDYDIRLTGDASLEAGISDASEKENSGPMEFIVALTKAASSDVTINYTFTDGTAINGTNYTGTDSSVTIHNGEQTAIISVPLIDTKMTTTKTFTVTITSSSVTVNSESASATGSIIGSDSIDANADDPDYDGPDICYDSRETSGFCMFGSCMFYQERTNVRAMVNNLEQINIKKALTRGMAFADFGSEIGTDDNSRTLEPNDDQAEKRSFASADFHGYYNVSMFPEGAEYRVGDGANETDGGSLDKDETTSYYDKSMFKFGLFTQYTTLVTYQKNGTTYQEVLQACDPDTHGSLESKPVVDDCGLFLDALNSASKINFQNSTSDSKKQEIPDTPDYTLNTPYMQNTNATAICNENTCSADGIGSKPIGLPSFRDSAKSEPVNIPYSLVIAEQHVGSLIVNHDANTEDPEDERTIVFEAPYSSSYGGRVMFINSIRDEDDHAQTYHYVFQKGDYWIGSWIIDKPKNVIIETSGDVRLFIKEDVSITLSGNLSIGNDEDKTSPKFYLYAYKNVNLDVTGNITIQNGYTYAKGTASFYSTGKIELNFGAITSDGELTITNGEDSIFNYYDASGDASGLFGECPIGGGGVPTVSGTFDAWDTFRDIDDRNISTKIVNSNFSLTIASLNDENTATEKKSGIDLNFRLYDMENSRAITAWQPFDADANEQITANFLINKAYRNVKVQFQFCEDGGNIAALATCNPSDPSYNANYELNTSVGSRDAFAIRPEKFSITTISLVKASKPTLYNVEATQAGGGASNDYNISNSIYTLHISETKYMPDDTVNTSLAGASNIYSYHFVDGTSSDLNISYSDAGKVQLHIQDQNWSAVDNDDTPLSCSGGVVNGVSIPNGTYICGDTNTTFIPSYFTIENVKLYNYKNSSFTYISNDLNVSARIALDIKAKGDTNNTLNNFDAASWENNVSITFNVTLPSSSLTLIKSEISNTKLGFANGVKSISWNDDNTSSNLAFNVQRDISNALNPFKIDGSNVTVNVSSIYSSLTIVEDTPKNASQSATMIYARTNTPKQRFDTNSGEAQIYFESYCFRTDANGNNCDKTLLPNGTSSKRTNDIRWYVNEDHNQSHGVVGNVSEALSTGSITTTLPTNTNPSKTTITYDESFGYPYRTTMQNTASTWLIYNPHDSSATTNEFVVEFEGGNSGWSGAHETDTTTKNNMTKKTNRRSMW